MGERITAQLSGIPSGARGVAATLRHMSRFALSAVPSLQIRKLALDLVRNIPERNKTAEAAALLRFVQTKIRYLNDPPGLELVQDPQRTLLFGQGDCDDKSTLLAALLLEAGIPCRFHAVGFAPGKFSHVYVDAYINGKWIAAETVNPRLGQPLNLGESVPGAIEHMLLEVK